MNRVSKIFQPISVIPKNALVKNQTITSKSQKVSYFIEHFFKYKSTSNFPQLMMELGLIRSTSNGSYHILPILQRSLDKCIKLVDWHMKNCDGQKLVMPVLTSSELWKKTGRYTNTEPEIMTTKDRHNKLQIISPTHEESVTSLLATLSPVSHKQLPLRLYQIGVKFRDEAKPRFGLIRGREFLMKDMYSFDVNREYARGTYERISQVYDDLFQAIGVPFVRVAADTGIMGGSLSHEFHYPASIGEDHLMICEGCGFAANQELAEAENCSKCGSENVQSRVGIEIAHTFLLDDKYSRTLGANVMQTDGTSTPLVMGCYGIGVSRLVAASLEVLSTETELRWPLRLAPFKIIIITPKEGSKEEAATKTLGDQLYGAFNAIYRDDVIVDDRINMTIGKRVFEAKRTGYPVIVVIGSKATDPVAPKFELIELACNRTSLVTQPELLSEINRIFVV